MVMLYVETFFDFKANLKRFEQNQNFKQKCFDPVITNLCKIIHWPLSSNIMYHMKGPMK